MTSPHIDHQHTRDSSEQLERELLAANELLANLTVGAPTSPLYASQLMSRIDKLKTDLLIAETDERTSALRIELSAALTERDALAERQLKITELDKIIADLRQRHQQATLDELRQQREVASRRVADARAAFVHAAKQAAQCYRQLIDEHRAASLPFNHMEHRHQFDAGCLRPMGWQGTVSEIMATGTLPLENSPQRTQHFEDTVEEKAA